MATSPLTFNFLNAPVRFFTVLPIVYSAPLSDLLKFVPVRFLFSQKYLAVLNASIDKEP